MTGPQLPPFPGAPPPAAITTKPRAVKFVTDNVQPPSGSYIVTEESLQLLIFNSFPGAVVTAALRVLDPDGVIRLYDYTLLPASTRLAQIFNFSFVEGFVLSVFATTSSNIRIGQCYVAFGMLRGGGGSGFATHIFAAGYVGGTSFVLGNPFQVPRYSTDGSGWIRTIQGTQPAAGADLNETVPTNAKWILREISAVLTTSAVANNRQVRFILDDGSNVQYATYAPDTQAATLAHRYNMAPAGSDKTVVGTHHFINLPNVVEMEPTWRWRTATDLIDVGDQWSVPTYVVEEWISL